MRGSDVLSVPKARNSRNNIAKGNQVGLIDKRNLNSSKVQTISNIIKGEPTLPGQLGWPKASSAANSGIDKSYSIDNGQSKQQIIKSIKK